MTGTFATLEVESRGGILTVALNRPGALNAFNAEMSVELAAALRHAQRDPDVRCVVLTGRGRAFCSGQDLRELADGPPLDFGAHLREKYNPLVARLRALEKPVIAAVNGIAAGAGASLALAADLRLMARSAGLRMAFVHLGLVPDAGATLTLMQHAGYGRAAELCLLGDTLSAEQALAYGLANRVVPDEDLPATAQAWAARLAALPATALGLTKRALQRAWLATLEDQLEYEAYLQATAGATADHREGLAAFLEKRPPRFGGR